MQKLWENADSAKDLPIWCVITCIKNTTGHFRSLPKFPFMSINGCTSVYLWRVFDLLPHKQKYIIRRGFRVFTLKSKLLQTCWCWLSFCLACAAISSSLTKILYYFVHVDMSTLILVYFIHMQVQQWAMKQVSSTASFENMYFTQHVGRLVQIPPYVKGEKHLMKLDGAAELENTQSYNCVPFHSVCTHMHTHTKHNTVWNVCVFNSFIPCVILTSKL